MLKQEYPSLYFGLYSILSGIGCKVKHNPIFKQITLGKSKIGAWIAALLQRFQNAENYT
jgi:hypothetical protein